MKPHQHPTFQTKLWAIIPAAGSGSRFSKTELKQYQLIDDKTVLEHTVDRLNGLLLDGILFGLSSLFSCNQCYMDSL
jgi:2-C-methyl-D-erythritol 4-phosphate cytidylyltransferase